MHFFEEKEKGKRCLENGNYGDALEYFDNASQLAITKEERAEIYTHMGDTYFENGQYEKAIDKYSAAIKTGDKKFGTIALLSRGNANVKKGDLKSAIEDYKATRKRDTKFTQAYLNEGDVYFYQGNEKEAFNCYAIGIKNAPESQKAAAHRHRANKSKGTQHVVNLSADLSRAWKLQTRNFMDKIEDARMMSYSNLVNCEINQAEYIYNKSIGLCNEAIQKYKDEKIGTSYLSDELYFYIQHTKINFLEKKGDEYIKNNMLEQAFESYCQAEKVFVKLSQDIFGDVGNRFQIFTKKGKILLKMNLPEQAVQAFQNAYKFATSNNHKIEFFKQMGDCYMQIGQPEVAVQQYTVAIDIADTYRYTSIQENALLLAKRGSAYWKDGKLEQGQADFDKMVGCNLKSGEWNAVYTQALVNMGDKLFKEQNTRGQAFELYNKALELQYDNDKKYDLHLHIAQSRTENFEFDKAIEQYEYAKKISCNNEKQTKILNGEILKCQGDKMIEAKQFEQAFKYYEDAVIEAPNKSKSKFRIHSAAQKIRVEQFETGFNECVDAMGLAETYGDKATACVEMSWGYYKKQNLEQAKQMAIYANEFEKNETTKKLLSAMELAEVVHEANKKIIKLVEKTFGRTDETPWVGIHKELIARTFDNGKKTAIIEKIEPIWKPLGLEIDRSMQ